MGYSSKRDVSTRVSAQTARHGRRRLRRWKRQRSTKFPECSGVHGYRAAIASQAKLQNSIHAPLSINRLHEPLDQRPMRAHMRNLYWLAERYLAPGLRSAQAAYADVLKEHVSPTTRWLDIGCGHQVFEPWIDGEREIVHRAALVVGSDPDLCSLRNHHTITHRVAALSLPFADASFSLVTANMVLEHLAYPADFFSEVRRVLRTGGKCIVHTPNSGHWQVWTSRAIPQSLKNKLIFWSEGRSSNDVYPTHYRANNPETLTQIGTEARFEVERIEMLDTSTLVRMYLGPFMLLDLLLVRLHTNPRFARRRSNIIGIFQAV